MFNLSSHLGRFGVWLGLDTLNFCLKIPNGVLPSIP